MYQRVAPVSALSGESILGPPIINAMVVTLTLGFSTLW